jgi:hypothetical protein
MSVAGTSRKPASRRRTGAGFDVRRRGKAGARGMRDFYEFFALGKDKAFVAVADVS